MERARRRNPRRKWAQVTVVLMDDAAMIEANRRCLGHAGSTDVITLAYRPVCAGGGWRGDILINLRRALDIGPRWGGADRELALYLAHGCDHLSGADDRRPAGRARMRRREQHWLRRARAEGLCPPFFPGGKGPSC
jgi:rRNA maturation RNase YbeY